jgi:hypothetical protein
VISLIHSNACIYRDRHVANAAETGLVSDLCILRIPRQIIATSNEIASALLQGARGGKRQPSPSRSVMCQGPDADQTSQNGCGTQSR